MYQGKNFHTEALIAFFNFYFSIRIPQSAILKVPSYSCHWNYRPGKGDMVAEMKFEAKVLA